MDLETLATLRAQLDDGGVPPIPDRAIFNAEEEALLTSLADDADRGSTERLERYRQVYTAARRTPMAMPELAVVPVLPDLDAAGPLGRDPRLEQTSPAPQLASFQIPGANAHEADPNVTDLVDTSAALQYVGERALPFDRNVRAAAPPASAPLAVQSGETQLADVRAVRAVAERAVIPFQPVAAAAAVETAEFDTRAAIAAAALPFTPSSSTGATPAATPINAHETGTAEVNVAALIAGPLPFGAAPEALSLDAEETHVGSALGSLSAALARRAPIAAALARSANPAVYGAQQSPEETLATYGFTPATWETSGQLLEIALTAHPELRALYEQLYREALNHVR